MRKKTTAEKLGMGGVLFLSIGGFAGWAYWMWMAFHAGSFMMFVFAFLGPTAFVAAALGLWSLFAGMPLWLVQLVS